MANLDLRQLVRIHKAIGHPIRLRILAMLQSGPLCVFQVTAALHLSPAAVSAHLGDLRRAGLLEDDNQGRFVWYGVTPDAEAHQIVAEALRHLKRSGEVHWDQIQVLRQRGRDGPADRPHPRQRGVEDAAKGDTP